METIIHRHLKQRKRKGVLNNRMFKCGSTDFKCHHVIQKELNPLNLSNLLQPIHNTHKTCRNQYLEFPGNLIGAFKADYIIQVSSFRKFTLQNSFFINQMHFSKSSHTYNYLSNKPATKTGIYQGIVPFPWYIFIYQIKFCILQEKISFNKLLENLNT